MSNLEELRARIRKTVDFAERVHEAQYEAQKAAKSAFVGSREGHRGEDYLLQITIPNVYFHIAMTYAVLRNGGVDVGKMDFLGPMNLSKLDETGSPFLLGADRSAVALRQAVRSPQVEPQEESPDSMP